MAKNFAQHRPPPIDCARYIIFLFFGLPGDDFTAIGCSHVTFSSNVFNSMKMSRDVADVWVEWGTLKMR